MTDFRVAVRIQQPKVSHPSLTHSLITNWLLDHSIIQMVCGFQTLF